MIVLNSDSVKANIIATRTMSEIPSPLREDLVTFGLARLVAYGTVLPANPVPNPVAFFNENNKGAKAVISTVNESMVLNVAKVLSQATDIYRARYDMVHTPMSKTAIDLAMAALVASGTYNFPQAIADALSVSEQSDAMGRSIAYVLNMFSLANTPTLAAADESSAE